MVNHEGGVKLDWPKEILDYLQQAGPFWSTVLGVALLGGGWLLHLPYLEGSGIAILVIGFLLLVTRRSSRLTRKEAFLAVRDVFVGRDQECDGLMDAINRAPLLWVSGESGSGKSSLLRLGILPRLTTSREWLPIYISNWGADWEAGPVASVSSALREAVESLGARLDTAAQPTAEDLSSYLKETVSQLRRTPVLILDQFDDYIADNLEKFRPGGGGLIVTAEELMQQNVFWRELGKLLKESTVRCLFVVRLDQGWGQGAISFVRVREFFVPRLQRQFLDKILRDLGSGSVENPERGWDALRGELEKDLYASGGILPIQMQVVVRELASLKSLTIAAYDRAGRIIGMSALYVSEVIDRVAAVCGTTPSTVRRLLHILVSPDNSSKTRDLSVDALRKELPEISENELIRVLEQLKTERVAHDHADESGTRRWRLNHDYLAPAVEELDRRENRIQQLLQQRAELFRTSGWGKKRGAIIQPADMCRIGWRWVRGTLKIGDSWLIVVVSLSYWCVLLACLAFAGYISVNRSFDSTARRYEAMLNRPGNVEPDEAKEWANLAQEPLAVRQRFEHLLLSDTTFSERVALRSDRARMAAAALGGLSAKAQDQFRMEIDCQTGDLTASCIFLASQFGQYADVVARKVYTENSKYPTDRSSTDWIVDLERYLQTDELGNACIEQVKQTPDYPLSQCRGLHASQAALKGLVEQSKADKDSVGFWMKHSMGGLSNDALTVSDIEAFLNGFEPKKRALATPVGAIILGKAALERSQIEGTCRYSEKYVTSGDIPTAIAALEVPACAWLRDIEIQTAIASATTHIPAGDVDRWTFARQWVQPNAAKYRYNPERFNTFYYSYILTPISNLVPAPLREFKNKFLHR